MLGGGVDEAGDVDEPLVDQRADGGVRRLHRDVRATGEL